MKTIKLYIVTLVALLFMPVMSAYGNYTIKFTYGTGLLGLTGSNTPDMIQSVTIDGGTVTLESLITGVSVTAGSNHTVNFTMKSPFRGDKIQVGISSTSTTCSVSSSTPEDGASKSFTFSSIEDEKEVTINLTGYTAHGFTLGPTSSSSNRVLVVNPTSDDVVPDYTLVDATTNTDIKESETIYFDVSGTKTNATNGNYDFTLTPKAGTPYYSDAAQTLYWTRASYDLNATSSTLSATIASKTYTGSQQTIIPSTDLTVSYNGTQLTYGTDYTAVITSDDNSNTQAGVHNHTVTITGSNNYVGTREVTATRTIFPKSIEGSDITVTTNPASPISIIYDGIEHSVTVDKVTDNTRSANLTDQDYSVSGVLSATNVNTYTITITGAANSTGEGNYTGTGNYTGSKVITWSIIPKPITSNDIQVTVDQATYTGSTIIPVVTITDPNNQDRTDHILTAETDYEISYKDSELKDAKTYVDEIIIEGKGNYAGTRYANFKIDPKGVTGLTATATVPYVDGGYSDADAVKAAWAVAVKDGTTPISSDLYDVTLAAGEYTNAGIYPDVVTITFKEGKNYEGAIITDLNMALGGIDISSALVTSTAVYNGTTQAPSASSILVKVGDNEDNVLIYNTDFTLEYNGKADDYVHAQTYSDAIIIRGKGKYYGTTIADYVILPCPISQTTITVDDPYYNASDFTDLNLRNNFIHMKIGDNTITDYYMVTPDKVKEAGTYTLTITGVANSNLIGSTTVTLKVRKSMTDPDYSGDFTFTEIPTQIYDGENAVQPEISVYDNGRLLIEGEEYTITYGDNTITEGATATGTITITGKGAYDPYDTPTYVTKKFAIVNEYFEEGNITYHAKSSTTVAVGNKGEAVTTLTGAVAIPATVTLDVTLWEITTPITFQVTGIEAGAFKNCTDITGITLPESIAEVEDGAFEGCTNLRYIDLSDATEFVPSTLQRNVTASPFYGVPKQALVYLNGTTFKGENYVYKAGTGAGAQYFCELFKIYDDMGGDQKHFAESDDYKWAYENVHQFTAYTITNTRMLTAEKHYTTCLPYSIAIPTGMKAYTLSASSDKLLGFEEVTTGILAAFTPYVLIPTTSGQLLSATNTEVPATTAIEDFKKAGETSATTVGGHKLVGTLRYMATGAAGCYIMQSGNTWKAFTGTGVYPNGACILPMRAYIVTSSYPAEARPFLSATFDSGTNIYNIDDLKFDSEDATYDLSGRKVQTPQKGLYIVGGKKMMRK